MRCSTTSHQPAACSRERGVVVIYQNRSGENPSAHEKTTLAHIAGELARLRGSAFAGEFALPVIGRVSMDLVALGCDAAPELKEGDWVELDYDLETASEASGLSQYELLTSLGDRFERVWR